MFIKELVPGIIFCRKMTMYRKGEVFLKRIFCLFEKLGGASGWVDDSDESTTEAED